MSKTVLLNSSQFDGNNKLIYRFPTNVELQGKEVCLVNLSFYNCFFNISAALANNSITIKFPVFTSNTVYTMTNYTHVFSDGFYSIEDINASFQNFFINNNLYLYDAANQQNMYFASFIQNSVGYAFQLNTYFVPTKTQADQLGLTGGCYSLLNPTGTRQFHSQIIIPSVGLGKLLGFGIGTYPTLPIDSVSGVINENPNAILGSLAPQINSVNSILLRTNIVNNNGISIPNDLLALVPVSSSFGAVNQYSANIPVYTRVHPQSYSYLEVSFHDQNLLPLFFRDSEITMTLHIRDERK
jgi:hypothetical protein